MAKSGLNKVLLIGRLGKDPEVKYAQSGAAVVKFTMATSEDWPDKSTGEKKERTEWHNIVAFGKLGEICGKYLTKGRQVYVEGRLQTRSWEKDGVTRYWTEIVADDMRILDPKGATGGAYSGAGAATSTGDSADYPPAASNYPQPDMPSGPGEDDIPF